MALSVMQEQFLMPFSSLCRTLYHIEINELLTIKKD